MSVCHVQKRPAFKNWLMGRNFENVKIHWLIDCFNVSIKCDEQKIVLNVKKALKMKF